MSNSITPSGKALIEVIKVQIKDNNPPETKRTYFRLLGEGIPEDDVYMYLARALAGEIFIMMREKKAFNLERYTKALTELPEDN